VQKRLVTVRGSKYSETRSIEIARLTSVCHLRVAMGRELGENDRRQQGQGGEEESNGTNEGLKAKRATGGAGPKSGFIGEVYEVFKPQRLSSPFDPSTTEMVAGGSPLTRQRGAVEGPSSN
jgi:hypothetical protein